MKAKLNAAGLKRHARQIKLLLCDVDGVLTNGSLFYVPDGQGGAYETKGFHSLDGLGFRWLQEMGIPAGWISGRESAAVVARAQMLQISYLYQNHLAKMGPYQEILQRAELVDEEVCYIGDDLTDAPIMKRVGLAVAVANAVPEVIAAAHYVTKAKGGEGAAREVIEIVLRAQNLWANILRKYDLEH
jgi:3-deoxy-D-manno-octulosonate 8-phosphate phosphatase (KDO 8-P phosphatase)